MTTTPRSPRLLLLSTTIMLAVAGVALLGTPHPQDSPATAGQRPSPGSTSALGVSPPGPLALDTSGATTPLASTPTGAGSVSVSALPPRGEGLGGDAVIQRSLESAWPADLAPADERVLLDAGRALLRADATGVGRAQWPTIFPASGQALAPAFSAVRWRVQAAIARREGAADRAVVHLVWAGADRGGAFAEGRVTDWHFTRTPLKEEGSPWIPQPRT
ncbi:hypothetical protein [Streptomyces melanogenes]|uniref:hypothetical protein n=1 Tax=Streptomyces melanogenes TaxID=67326 RepID=UPI00167DF23F|nr:hypothetical protein [Streptomyces melanogenes]GGP93143.1 hypothetical protein GCM10010278_83960 [Streptomyces melanogenes]